MIIIQRSICNYHICMVRVNICTILHKSWTNIKYFNMAKRFSYRRNKKLDFWFRSGQKPEPLCGVLKNQWHDYGLGKGGNVIDLVCMMENCIVTQALDYLSEAEPSSSFQHQELFEAPWACLPFSNTLFLTRIISSLTKGIQIIMATGTWLPFAWPERWLSDCSNHYLSDHNRQQSNSPHG